MASRLQVAGDVRSGGSARQWRRPRLPPATDRCCAPCTSSRKFSSTLSPEAFGRTYLKEQTRDMWIFPSLESLRHDVRYALRTLRKSPGFTVVAVFALAVGIGGNTAIFSLMSASRQQALPYPDPDRLVELWGNVMRAKVERRGASVPDYLDWRAQSKSFE